MQKICSFTLACVFCFFSLLLTFYSSRIASFKAPQELHVVFASILSQSVIFPPAVSLMSGVVVIRDLPELCEEGMVLPVDGQESCVLWKIH